MRVSNKLKAVVAAVGSVVTALSGAFADNLFNADEVGTVATALAAAVATVYGVWKAPNKDDSDAS